MPNSSLPAVNWTELVAACGADEALARTVTAEFAIQVTPQVELLSTSISSGHTRAALTAAHKLKGSVLAIFASRAAEYVRQLENALRNNEDPTNLLNRIIIEAELVRHECTRLSSDIHPT